MKSTAASSRKSQPADWNVWNAAKRTAIEYLAVFISSIGFIFTFLSLLVACIALWLAFDARTEARVAQLELQAYIREQSQ